MDPITLSLALSAFGIGTSVLGQVKAGAAAKRQGEWNAISILRTSEENAKLIEEGTKLNVGVFDFNAAALDAQAKDAITRGEETETRFRKDLRGFIGSQRAGYAGQGVELSDGSPLDVQMDTARQGEQDALTLRLNAAREAWGFNVAAKGERLQGASTGKLGRLQARNVRRVGEVEAENSRQGGNAARSAANWGAASTLATGAGNIIARKYGY